MESGQHKYRHHAQDGPCHYPRQPSRPHHRQQLVKERDTGGPIHTTPLEYFGGCVLSPIAHRPTQLWGCTHEILERPRIQKIKKQNEVRDAAGLKKFQWSLQRPSQGPEKWSPVMPGYRATFKNDSSIHQSDVLFCYFHSFLPRNWQAFDVWWVGLCVLASTLFHSLCLVFLIRLLLLSTTTTTKMLQLTTTNFLS